MRKLLALMISLSLMSCSTIRMKYSSRVTEEGSKDVQKFEYINSYPVGGAHSVICALTAIYFGGYCWFYLAMPTVAQSVDLREDATTTLEKKMAGKKFVEENVRVERVDFSVGEPQVRLTNKTPTIPDAE